VTSDTVLKWIRKGHISGIRTAGGHHRIARAEIEGLLRSRSAAASTPQPPPVAGPSSPLRCWEYLGGTNGVREECTHCSIYHVRAGWCFAMAGMGLDIDHSRQLCASSCQDCVYYRRVMNLPTQVLLVSRDDQLTQSLSEATVEGLSLRVAASGYQASTTIQSFRPAFAIVDEALIRSGETDLLRHLARDPRLSGLKIILAVPKGRTERKRDQTRPEFLVSSIEKPFELREVQEIIERFPVESLQAPDAETPVALHPGGSADAEPTLRASE